VIGFQLGLFSSAVVNAVLVLILVSVLASTLVGERASRRASSPDGPHPLGMRVVVGVADPELALGALTVAHRIARADGGVVHPVLVVPESAPFQPKPALARLGEVVAEAGVDGQLMTIVDRSVLHGALRVGRSQEATLVLVAEPAAVDEHADSAQAGSASSHAAEQGEQARPALPVAVVRGNAARLGTVRTRLEQEQDDGLAAPSVVAEMARRVSGGSAHALAEDHAEWAELLAPGDVTFVSSGLGDALAKLPGAADGLVISSVAEWVVEEELVDEATPELPGDASI
jgi:hypothetical protein